MKTNQLYERFKDPQLSTLNRHLKDDNVSIFTIERKKWYQIAVNEQIFMIKVIRPELIAYVRYGFALIDQRGNQIDFIDSVEDDFFQALERACFWFSSKNNHRIKKFIF